MTAGGLNMPLGCHHWVSTTRGGAVCSLSLLCTHRPPCSHDCLPCSRLMGLQLRDATFRRHFLLQCLILMQARLGLLLPAAC